MLSVGSYEAKTHLPALLKRVAAGEQITITLHGTPMARLVPCEVGQQPDPKVVIGALRSFRKGRKLGKLSLRKMIREGRRF